MCSPETPVRQCVAVMAGGRGLRLWPRSTSLAPKQFHSFFGGSALLQQSLSRAALLAPPCQTYVVTTSAYLDQVNGLVGPGVRVLAEPAGRDTAACAGLAALHIERDYPDAIITLLPADHWIGDQETFTRTLRSAAKKAEAYDCLVTIGIRPTRPETGYGYIQVEEQASGHLLGKRFLEKPDTEEAARLIAGGKVFWNSGIYVSRASTLLKLISQHMPGLGAGLDLIASALDTVDADDVTRLVYSGLSSLSLDKGVTERLDRFLVIPADFPWDDLGSWTAFFRVHPRDESGNILAGRVNALDSADCLVDTPDLQTVLLGIRNLIIVQDGDRLLVCSAYRAQDVKQIASASDSPPSAHVPHVVLKPWGREVWWAVTPAYAGKVLEVRAGERLSLQYHRRKLETLLCERGEGELILGEERLPIRPGLTVTVQPGTLHQVIAHTNLRILEVSTPDLDDVVRVQDDYGRRTEQEGNPP